MYDRATRALSDPNNKDVSEYVGPGSYEQHHRFTDRKPIMEGYAPFQSMAPRTTFLDVPDQVIMAPGPGHYYPEMVIRDRAKGGSTVGNMEARFRDPSSETPGPGTYSTDLQWIKPRSMPLPEEQVYEGTGHITWKRKVDPPSIPSPGKSFGYEEGTDGALLPQAGPDKDSSLGPAYYKPGVAATIAEKRYKGVHWSKATENRFKFSCADMPGPGQYNPHKEPVVQEKFTITEAGKPKKFESRIPRYHELIPLKEEKKNNPGPGSYNIKSTIDRPIIAPNEAAEPTPFGSRTRRFTSGKNPVPAPGQYNDPRHAFEALRRISGLKKSPFGQTSSRFTMKDSRRTPGPGTYNVDVMTSLNTNIQKKAHMSSSTKGVFGTSSVRTLPYTKHEDKHLPGPSHYIQDSNVIAEKLRKTTHATSVFMSGSERIKVPGALDKDIPPPGSYNVEDAYSKSQVKKSTAQPRTLAGQIKAGSFLSSSARFAPPRDILIKEADPMVPGPGAYEQAGKQESYMKGTLVSQTPRFVEKNTKVPGPGHYNASILYRDTLLKPTFNVTLNNPVMIKDVKSRSESKQLLVTL